jgi:hypothetical protein
MRLVQATVPSDVRQDVKDALDNHDIEVFATDETSTDEYEEVCTSPSPRSRSRAAARASTRAASAATTTWSSPNTEVDSFSRTDKQRDSADGHERIAAAEPEGHTEDRLPDYRSGPRPVDPVPRDRTSGRHAGATTGRAQPATAPSARR